MKKFFAVCGGLLAVLLLAVGVRAEEVKTPYFTLDLPSGWKQLQNVTTSNGELNVMVINEKTADMLNITIAQADMSLKELCTEVCNSLKAAGVTVSEPVMSGDGYVAEFSQGSAQGRQYFTSNGKLACAVSIIGDAGKELMQTRLKPVDPKLFPASY